MPKKKTRFKQKFFRRRILVALAFDVFFVGVIAAVFSLNPLSHAANYSITAGSHGPLCNSGGYMTPNSLTIPSGSTVTISVPANDPYSGGQQIHGFLEGVFTVQNGTSHTTQPITSDVNFYGSWPDTGCLKGSGTITISHTAPPPNQPPPSPAPTPHTKSSFVPPPSPSAKNAGPTPTPHPSSHESVTKPSPSPNSGQNGSVESAKPQGSSGVTKNLNATETKSRLSPQRKAVGYSSIFFAVAISGWIIWQLFVRPKPLY